MKSSPPGGPIISVQLDRILESAVILSWNDLLHRTQTALIHIEYTPGTRLSDLKVWQLNATGKWILICEYWTSLEPIGTPITGLRFSNCYHSAGLAGMLEVIIGHQDNFAPSLKPGSGLIQVTLPRWQDKLAANACMKHVYESFGLTFARIPAAALA